jgi:SPP1 gp7 family putative phage head morphogenesis protein
MNTELLADTIADKVAEDYLTQSFNAVALEAMFREMIKEALVDCRESGIVSDIAEEVIEHGFCTCGHISKKELNEVESEKQKKNSELFKALFETLGKYEVEYKAMLASVWEKERKIIISNLKKMKKAWLQKDKIDDILYPVAPFEKLLSDNALIIDLKIIDEQGKTTMASIAGTDVVFSVTNPEVQNWLRTYTPKFSKELEKVSVEKLRKELSEGIAAGEGIPELTKRVNETYANWNKVRSESIARSETMRASNQASLEAYKQSGVVTKKVWVTHFDKRTCEWCKAMDGKVISIEKSFFAVGSRFTVDGQTMKLDYEVVEAPPLHSQCYDKETEVYTNEEWKYFKDLTGKEKCWSMNPENNEEEFLPIKERIAYRYKGVMLAFIKDLIKPEIDIDLLVTPNHIMVMKEGDKLILKEALKISPDKFIPVSYDDMVYCVELPKYHTLWVRRNGKTAWSGNCRCTVAPEVEET